MQRTQISLTEAERALLDAISARTVASMSSLIRSAADQVYGSRTSQDEDLAALRAGFGGGSGRGDDADDADSGDGADFVDRLRSGGRLQA